MASVTPNRNLVQIDSREALIRRRLEQERQSLEKEAGIGLRTVQHFHRPQESPFTRTQRDSTTILFGGLT